MASFAALVLGAAGLAGLALALALMPAAGGGTSVLTEVTTTFALATTGATGLLLAIRRRRNALGWLLLGSFVLLAGLGLVQNWSAWQFRNGVDTGAVAVAVWLGNWLWVPLVGLVGLYPALLFPDGHFQDRRWRAVGMASAGALAVMSAGFALDNSQYTGASGGPATNPVGDILPQGVVDVLRFGGAFSVIGLVGLALIGLFVRYRNGSVIVRVQLRWFFAAGALWLVFLAYPGDHGAGGVIDVLGGLVLAAYPVAIAVAVMRYHLFDIDRIISRTTSYAIVTACVLTLYAAIVTTTTRVFANTSNLVVAAATLTAAATARPLLHRVRRVVDRRFNRGRYDASRTTDAFASRLRNQIDPLSIQRSLLGAVGETLEPITVSLWMRP